jgi:polar amino acid transport system permease protein
MSSPLPPAPKRSLFWLSRNAPVPSRRAWLLSALLLATLALAVGAWILHRSTLQWNWSALAEYWRLFLDGWKNTLQLSLASLLLSTALGALLAFSKASPFLPLQMAASAWIELLRGTPFLAQIYVFFYIVAESVRLENRFLSGTLCLSLFCSAYIAEILRGGIASVGESQRESARSLGLSPWQIQRHVVLPQALRAAFPSLAGQLVSLIKDSSLLSIIGLNELTQSARNVASYTFSNFESYVLLALGYLLLTLPLSLWIRRLESRLHYEN